MHKVIVIVPAYNEAEKITETVKALLTQKESFSRDGRELLIYVVNDGSADDTAKLAKKAGADRILNHKLNMGLGAAVRTGLAGAHSDGADIVVKFDADLQHDPADILPLITPILKDEADVVYGSRFEKIQYRMPFVRKIGNRVFTGIMRWLTKWPLTDSQPGILAVNSAYLQVSYLPGDYNYTQQLLLDAYHKGMRFAQVSVTFNRRETGASFISMKYPFKVLPQIVQVLVGVKPLLIFAPVGLVFLGLGSLVFGVDILQWLFGASPKPVQHVNLVLGLSTFGLQTLFFGLLADLIVKLYSRRNNGPRRQ